MRFVLRGKGRSRLRGAAHQEIDERCFHQAMDDDSGKRGAYDRNRQEHELRYHVAER